MLSDLRFNFRSVCCYKHVKCKCKYCYSPPFKIVILIYDFEIRVLAAPDLSIFCDQFLRVMTTKERGVIT